MYTKTYPLKQHTPLIHFQPKQAGATLRATEVKPKLDRYILIQLGKEELPDESDTEIIYTKGKEIAKSNGWLIGDGNHALDYKMRINGDVILNEIENAYPCYFGNLGNNKKDANSIDNTNKCFSFSNTLEVSINTLYISLSNVIHSNLNDFFALHNFGTRQSKGFGIFTISDMSQEAFESALLKKYNLIFVTAKPNFKIHNLQIEHKKIFDFIDKQYKKLKTGNPQENNSLLRFYFLKRHQTEWEKPKIQGQVSAISRKKLKIDNRLEGKEKYIRAILGLTDGFDYKQLKVNVSIKNKEIERFQSPITVKVFNNNIYFCPEKISDSILEKLSDKEFSLSYKYYNREDISFNQIIKTPNFIHFSLNDFLMENLDVTIWEIIEK